MSAVSSPAPVESLPEARTAAIRARRARPHGPPALAAAAAVLALLVPAGHAAAQPPALSASQPARSVTQVRDYWTPARMRAAEPVALRPPSSGPPAVELRDRAPGQPSSVPQARRRAPATDASGANTAFPDRVHGKVFFTIERGSQPGDYVCSGTVVVSPSHALVWTAGHCVNDASFGGGFAKNWVFVPGYRDGARPFGTWPAVRLFTPRTWQRSANIRTDLGAATVARDSQGRGIEDVVGARGIAFNQPRDQSFQAFGYPALPTLLRPEFNGERLYTCDSQRTGDDDPPGGGPATLEISCDMSGGASGGGWVIDGGRVNSVTSYSYLGDFEHLYGPYLGTIARGLYLGARGRRVLCAGREVTNLGGAGPDDFLGTDSGDAIKPRGGGDRVRGGAGADRICAGAGGDLIRGGPGRDLCIGGPGLDRARGCERRRGIP